MRAWVLLVLMLLGGAGARAAELVDATGRSVAIPDHVARVLPAGPPAAVLIAALAPDVMVGWTPALPDASRALVAPAAAGLPQVPRLTGRADVTAAIAALKPDLIVDYGTVSPRYADLARTTQQRTGIPTVLLDGALGDIPDVLRKLGAALHREARAEALAAFAEAVLALPAPATARTVVYARGADGLTVAAPGTDATEVFARLGWRALAPDGAGMFRPASIAAIGALDPDMLVFSDPHMREVLAQDEAWRSVRAVREGHAFVAPSAPFGWVEEPPSINRLLGLAWLGGFDPRLLAALFNAVVYGHVLTAAQGEAVLAGLHPMQR